MSQKIKNKILKVTYIRKNQKIAVGLSFVGSLMILAFQNFTTLGLATGDCNESFVFACIQNNREQIISELEQILPPLDSTIVNNNPSKNVIMVADPIQIRYMDPNSFKYKEELSYTFFPVNNTLYNFYNISTSGSGSMNGLNNDEYIQTRFKPVYDGPMPKEFEFIDFLGKVVLKNSTRKIVKMYAEHGYGYDNLYVTTRDNKLYYLPLGHYRNYQVIANKINPFTLSRGFVAGLDNRVYSISEDIDGVYSGLRYLMTAPVKLENPVIQGIWGTDRSPSSVYFDVRNIKIRLCSLNSNRDYYCTGVFSSAQALNFYSPTALPITFTSHSDAILVARNICATNLGAWGTNYFQADKTSMFHYSLLVDCNGVILTEGFDTEVTEGPAGAREFKFYTPAQRYQKTSNFSFEPPGTNTPVKQFSESASCVNGSSYIAYKTQLSPDGYNCSDIQETRECINGTLTGSYEYKVCRDTNKPCDLDGQKIQSGDYVVAYFNKTLTNPDTCAGSASRRHCKNGHLSGQFQFLSCQDATQTCGPNGCLPSPSAKSCSFNGSTITHKGSVKAFKTASVPNGSSCLAETRICNNGSLSGTYTSSTCKVEVAPSSPSRIRGRGKI